jgi:hypothetical protein
LFVITINLRIESTGPVLKLQIDQVSIKSKYTRWRGSHVGNSPLALLVMVWRHKPGPEDYDIGSCIKFL